MRITVVNGLNHKNYLYFHDFKSDRDLQLLAHAKTIVTRSEYKPYIKAFNKNVTESFFIEENNCVPAQFIQDIQTKLLPSAPGLQIERLDRIYDNNFDDEFFQQWLDNIILPEGFTVETDEYIYQKMSVRNLLIARVGRIEIGTGGGKTLITYLYIKYLLDNVLRKITEGANKILLVIDRKDLIIQTVREFNAFDANNTMNDNEYNVPLIMASIYSGAKKVANANVVVATWQSIKDYDPDWFLDFKVFMVDEAHKGKAYNIRQVIYNQCRNIEYCAGFTGTWQEYQTLDYLSVVSMFGPLVYKKTTRQLIDDGNVCDVLIVRININYDISEQDFRQRINENNPDLLPTERYLLEKAWYHQHTHRSMIAVTLINKLPNNHLILVDTVSYIQVLADLIAEHCPDTEILIIYSQVNTETREARKHKMQNEHRKVMIATKETMSTGVSINNIWYVHNIDGGKSPITTSQGLGRSLRKYDGKEKAHYFDYNDNVKGTSFYNHAKERLKIFHKAQLSVQEISVNLKPMEYEIT